MLRLEPVSSIRPLTGALDPKLINRALWLVIGLLALGCKAKPAAGTEKKKTPWEIVRGAYFSTPISTDNKVNGYWTAKQADFKAYIEARFLRGYKPEALENSAAEIRRNLKDARYFLRINFPACDELFYMSSEEFTVSIGELNIQQVTVDNTKYTVVFRHRNNSGKVVAEKGLLVANAAVTQVELWFGENKLKLYRETKNGTELANQLEKVTPATGLVQY